MIDFLTIATRSSTNKKGVIEVYPKFIIKNPSSDLMIRGGDFYAVWIEERGLWSTNEQDVIQMIDRELDKYAEENQGSFEGRVRVLHMWDAESGMIDRWHKYCQKQMRDSFHMLDEELIFSNTEVNKKDYASKRLPYPLEDGDLSAYDKLMSTLYSPEERKKIEWAIGSIVSGDSKKLQKFLVLYGAAGTGKSTVLNIIQQLFEGYYSVFDARSLGSSSNSFALEAFKTNPLVAIQHDGDLSHIEDNTRLNSLVSHEMMTVNEKFKSTYQNRFKSFLFMGTNRPVKITDAKSGLLRRLIDVTPTGETVPQREYKTLVKQIAFELGAIAKHCLDIYESEPDAYDDYVPISMMGASNDFFNFVTDAYFDFKKDDGVTLAAAWELYKNYCDSAKVGYPMNRRVFTEELKNYFREFVDRYTLSDGTRVRKYYKGFLTEKIDGKDSEKIPGEEIKETSWLEFKEQHSLLDDILADCPAQYAVEEGKVIRPEKKWGNCKTTLKDIDTSKLHYVKTMAELVSVDFDIPGADGKKSFEKNYEEASKWPKTYAELSKSGAGIHLEYFYTGDLDKLDTKVSKYIEIKRCTGDGALRRMVTKCNDIPIATISSGLPLKGEKNVMVNFEAMKSEKGIRKLIERNLRKEIHPGTKPSIDFIFKILEDAYTSGMKYDVSDMQHDILVFAMHSTHQADLCVKTVSKMKFKSDDLPDDISSSDGTQTSDELVFYDIEVFPNLFLICWKVAGEGKPIVRMFNPDPEDVEKLMKMRLVGFNCRKYDNHLIYARSMGYSVEELYKLSQNIINDKEHNHFFSQAYNISYTDIYDFSSKKQSLKKFEIELGIHHQELGLPWDEPVPKELWDKVASYCDNDVLATEATFNARHADFVARQILADVAGGTVNDTTNTLTTRLIFGKNKSPQSQFNYRFMGDITTIDKDVTDKLIKRYFGSKEKFDEYTAFDKNGRPVFPGYTYEKGKSFYRDDENEVGEGGRVYAEPGIHVKVALDDISSQHPHSIVAETLFGEEYTRIFKELLDTRIAIKHKDFDTAKKLLGGVLAKYLDDEKVAKDLAQALKIAINSVYGLTSAKFSNPFRDPRNKDNIVAKRGALFMINLTHEVQKRGYTVAHIKTDSIKIPNADDYILDFVDKYGKMYGYNFEHEATYERMCLVNNAVYIAKYDDGEHEFTLPTGQKVMTPWTATGTQFQVPYVFKSCFSQHDILFEDVCETKSVSKGSIYIDMNEDLPNVEALEKELSNTELSYEKGKMSDTTFESEVKRLKPEIAKGHNYVFVGRVGQFCPIIDGKGGGTLYRYDNNKYYALAGTTGYKWLESEVVKELGKEEYIDHEYYDHLVSEAIETISSYGSYERFVSEEPYDIPAPDFINVPEGVDDVIPFT